METIFPLEVDGWQSLDPVWILCRVSRSRSSSIRWLWAFGDGATEVSDGGPAVP
jgi:hypothetical protein